MPDIKVAEQAGVGADGAPRPSEDRLAVLDNAVLVLDGATAPDPSQPGGGPYAGRLVDVLSARLRSEPTADLGAVLAGAIEEVTGADGWVPGAAPSATVAMLRWDNSHVDGLVLADSPIIAFGRSGIQVVADDRLRALRAHGKLMDQEAVRGQRNVEGGFWVAEADPAAANHAIRFRWQRSELDAVLLATDGVATGVDDYRVLDWARALELARQDPNAVLEVVRDAERADPDRTRWPRPKRHDDQALALVDFRAGLCQRN